MRSILASLPFAGLTVLCWGSYGPILHASKGSMGNNSWAQLLWVGIAYFLIAVIIPLVMLRTKGEEGKWTKGGFFFGLTAGTFGALGALGIITALTRGGDPIYVMPIVFGGAPVINTLVSMWIGKLFSKATSGFYLGIILVAVGAAGVLITKPSPEKAHEAPVVEQQDEGETDTGKETSVMLVIAGIALTVLCWGSYGTVLHKSQAKMGGSRLRPLFCVGLAYFLVAIIVPILILSSGQESITADMTLGGSFGSLMAGVCGALGALGIILSFTYGGKPIFVMPLVFGGAPIINTMIGVAEKGTGGDGWAWFIASLTIVIVGAITTLVCAPKAGPGKPVEEDGDAPEPEDDKAPKPEDDKAPGPEDDKAPGPEDDKAPEPEDDKAPEPEAPAPEQPTKDSKSESEVDQDELDTVAGESMEAPGAADGKADTEQSEFSQSVEELGTVVAGSLDELKSKLEDSRMAHDEDDLEVDQDELDTVAADSVDDLDSPEDDTGKDEETDEEEQHDS